MAGHGRSYIVLVLLLISMGFGTVVLMKLEGKPFKAMPYSLSSQTLQRQDVGNVLMTDQGVAMRNWNQVEVVLVNTENYLGREDVLSGKLNNQYHFVISNGFFGTDGKIYRTDCWAGQMVGRQEFGGAVDGSIRICVLVDKESPKGTVNQDRRLEDLVSTLTNYYNISRRNIVSAF